MNLEEKNIAYRWKPNLSDKRKLEDCADEYAIEKREGANAGIVIYGKFHGEWKANPLNLRHLVNHLIEKLDFVENEGVVLGLKIARKKWGEGSLFDLIEEQNHYQDLVDEGKSKIL